MKTKIIMAGSAVGLGLTLYFMEIGRGERVQELEREQEREQEQVLQREVIATAFTEVVAEYPTTDELLAATRKPDQLFTIDPSQDQTITGKEGTIIRIPANSLVNASGKSISAPVTIRLTECYDLTDMIMNKLSTTSNGKLLETAGMINVTASSGGEDLTIKKDANYQVDFPRKSTKEDFKLFYGTRAADGVINWELAEKEQEKEQEKERELEEDGEGVSAEATRAPVTENCFVQISDSYFRRNLKISKMDYYSWKLADGQSLNNWFVANFNPTAQLIDDYCVFNYQTEVTIKLEPNGTIRERHITKSATPEYDKAILNAVDQFPPFDMSTFMPEYDEDHAVALRFGKKIGRSQDEFALAFEKKFKGKEDQILTDIKKDELDYFVFSSNKLGWLNVDRFYNEPGEKCDFYVSCPSPEKTNINLAFEDFDGLLAGRLEGDKIVFENVPKGKKVKLIGIESSSTTPTMCIAHSKTSTKPTELKEFKTFKLNELKATLG